MNTPQGGDASRTFDIDGCMTAQGDHIVILAMDYGGAEDGSVDDAVKILRKWGYKVTENN